MLEEQLGKSNSIHLKLPQDDVPMVYPYLTQDATLKKRLIANRIFVATYWPNVDVNGEIEATLKMNLLPMPIDQRYNQSDAKANANAIAEFAGGGYSRNFNQKTTRR